MLWRLYRWRLRTQPGQEALAVAGIAIGVALIFAVEIASTSVPASVRQLYRAIAGNASIEVAARTPEGFDQRLVPRVGEAPGVFGASAILDAQVTVIGPRGQLILTLFGAEPGLSAIGGSLAHRFPRHALESATPVGVQSATLARALAGAHVDTIALPEAAARALGASAGQLLALDVRGRSVLVLCGAVLSTRQVGGVAESPVAIALLPAAQRITGLQNRVTRILVAPQRGEQALAKRSLARRFGSTLNVRASSSEVSLLEEAVGSQSQAAAAFTALSVLVGMLFAYNAMLLTLPARRRGISRLRDMGAYRHELGALLALEVVVLGAAASLVGLALGDLLSSAVFGAVPRYLTSGFPIGTQRVITPMAVLIAIGGGMLATALAAAGPTIVALRGRPLERPSEPAQATLSLGVLSGPAGVGVGSAAIVLTLAIALLAPSQSILDFVILAVALASLLPPIVPWLLERSRRLALRLGRVAGYVSAIELKAAPTRATAVAATSAIALYAIVAIGGAGDDLRRGVGKTIRDVYGDSTVVVTAASFAQTAFAVQPFAAAGIVARLRATGGVEALGTLRQAFLDARGHRLFVIAKPAGGPLPVSPSQIMEGSAGRVAQLLRAGGWATLSATVAREWHLRLGDRFVLPTPSGSRDFRLAATTANYGWPPGAVVIGPAEYERLWHTADATVLDIRFEPGTSEAQALRAVRGALRGSGLVASTGQSVERDIASATNQALAQLGQISTLVLVAAVLAVIAAMAGSIWQRRSRLATLKRLGMRRGELVRTIYFETGVVTVIGCLAGLVFGLGGQPIATLYTRQSTGVPEAYSPALGLGIEMVAIATAVAVAVTGAFGYIMTRHGIEGRWSE